MPSIRFFSYAIAFGLVTFFLVVSPFRAIAWALLALPGLIGFAIGIHPLVVFGLIWLGLSLALGWTINRLLSKEFQDPPLHID